MVLVGRKTQIVEDDLRARGGLRVLGTFHPSARVFNVWPEKKTHFLETLRIAASR